MKILLVTVICGLLGASGAWAEKMVKIPGLGHYHMSDGEYKQMKERQRLDKLSDKGLVDYMLTAPVSPYDQYKMDPLKLKKLEVVGKWAQSEDKCVKTLLKNCSEAKAYIVANAQKGNDPTQLPAFEKKSSLSKSHKCFQELSQNDLLGDKKIKSLLSGNKPSPLNTAQAVVEFFDAHLLLAEISKFDLQARQLRSTKDENDSETNFEPAKEYLVTWAKSNPKHLGHLLWPFYDQQGEFVEPKSNREYADLVIAVNYYYHGAYLKNRGLSVQSKDCPDPVGYETAKLQYGKEVSSEARNTGKNLAGDLPPESVLEEVKALYK